MNQHLGCYDFVPSQHDLYYMNRTDFFRENLGDFLFFSKSSSLETESMATLMPSLSVCSYRSPEPSRMYWFALRYLGMLDSDSFVAIQGRGCISTARLGWKGEVVSNEHV